MKKTGKRDKLNHKRPQSFLQEILQLRWPSELPWVGLSRSGLYIFHPSHWMWASLERTEYTSSRELSSARSGPHRGLQRRAFSFHSSQHQKLSALVLKEQCKQHSTASPIARFDKLWPKCSLLHVLVDEIFLDHSHGHLLIYYLWLLPTTMAELTACA